MHWLLKKWLWYLDSSVEAICIYLIKSEARVITMARWAVSVTPAYTVDSIHHVIRHPNLQPEALSLQSWGTLRLCSNCSVHLKASGLVPPRHTQSPVSWGGRKQRGLTVSSCGLAVICALQACRMLLPTQIDTAGRQDTSPGALTLKDSICQRGARTHALTQWGGGKSFETVNNSTDWKEVRGIIHKLIQLIGV